MWAWQPYDTPVNQLTPGATIGHCHNRRTPGFLVGVALDLSCMLVHTICVLPFVCDELY